MIGATRYNSPSALAEINRLDALSPAALRAAAVAQIDDPAPAVRDAARHALAVSVTAEDAAAVVALRDLLDADDDAGRLTAAGGLHAHGLGSRPLRRVGLERRGGVAGTLAGLGLRRGLDRVERVGGAVHAVMRRVQPWRS